MAAMELPEEPEDFYPEDELDVEAMLDRTPLKFGKYKGITPEKLAETGGYDNKGNSWLKWAYENVFNFDVCSAALYRDCGGRGTRAVDPKGKKRAADQGEDGMNDRYESRGYTNDRNPVPKDVRYPPGTPLQRGFDDYDDDIPF